MPTLNTEQLIHALSLRDLTDPEQGPHAMQHLVNTLRTDIAATYDCPLQLWRAHPIVTVRENYDALGYPADGPARESRYSRYLASQWMLRTQTSTLVPNWLRSWHDKTPRRLALMTPGLVYRRDSIDRLHTGEPHQLDVWVVMPTEDIGEDPHWPRNAIKRILGTVLPEHAYTLTDAEHPYTRDGVQIDVLSERNELVEVGEGGRIDPDLLRRTGWDPDRVTGLALGLGLDRVLMLRKHLDDIRLLRSRDPRIAEQMQTLDRWRPVSWQPAIQRDLSIAADVGVDAELLGDRVREALPERADWLERVEVIDETPADDLPRAAIDRLGLRTGQKNVLVRLIIRHPSRSITSEEANDLRNRVYRAIHQGERLELA